MSFLTGAMLIDAPASALNNLGKVEGAADDNIVGVKVIRAKDGIYPYVSAQAFRYWLRETLDDNPVWRSAPTYREEKVAYTDANPIIYWDDDLFGYMRAPSKKTSAVEKRAMDVNRGDETPTTDTVTRVSPFRVSTLVSIAPMISLTEDFGVMSRHEGDPVPHVHQFYRTTLEGLFSLDLHAVGTFSYRYKTGYRNLDVNRIKLAQDLGLDHLENEKCYRLALQTRVDRIEALLDGLGRLEGGAKLAIHYTDVNPALVFLAVTRGGNHIFGHIIGSSTKGQPVIKTEALEEVLHVFGAEIQSPIFVGWSKGYLDDERIKLEAWAKEFPAIQITHPRQAYAAMCKEIQANMDWLD